MPAGVFAGDQERQLERIREPEPGKLLGRRLGAHQVPAFECSAKDRVGMALRGRRCSSRWAETAVPSVTAAAYLADAASNTVVKRVTALHSSAKRSKSNEGRFEQKEYSELVADLEAILLELRNRLNNYLDLGADDLIAADEGFNFAGQLQATLSDASDHATRVRERLIEIQRKDS